MGSETKQKAVTTEEFFEAIEAGTEMVANKEVTKKFVFGAMEMTLALADRHELNQALMYINDGIAHISSMSGDIYARLANAKTARAAKDVLHTRQKEMSDDAKALAKGHAGMILKYVLDMRQVGVGEPDGPAFMTAEFLADNAFNPELKKMGYDTLVPVTDELIVWLLETSEEWRQKIINLLQNVNAFYEEKQEAELGNFEASQNGLPQEGKTATTAESKNEPPSKPQPSADSQTTNANESSANTGLD